MYKSNEYTEQKELFLSWGQTPLMEHLSEKLQELVPFEGEVEDKKNNHFPVRMSEIQRSW